jgi:hypothetical protein
MSKLRFKHSPRHVLQYAADMINHFSDSSDILDISLYYFYNLLSHFTT